LSRILLANRNPDEIPILELAKNLRNGCRAALSSPSEHRRHEMFGRNFFHDTPLGLGQSDGSRELVPAQDERLRQPLQRRDRISDGRCGREIGYRFA